MAGLFSSGEQDLLGNIMTQRQQANQALGSGYGKYGGIVQAAGGLIDTGTDAMFGGKVGAADPRMQQMGKVKELFSKAAMEVGNTTTPAFYERLSQELQAGGYPEQAQKAADKAIEVKKAKAELAPKDPTLDLLKTGKYTPESIKEAMEAKDFSKLKLVGKAADKTSLEKKMDLAGITDPKQRQAMAQQSLELDLKAKEGDPTAIAAIELMKKQLDVQILQNKLEQTKAEQTAAAAAKVQGASAEAYKTNNILNTIDTAIGQVGGSTAGLGGAVMSQIPGSKAVDLQENLLTIKANIGFNELSQMRKDSPTGGALGQVSDMENKALQAARASLEQRQSPDQLRTNLNKIKDSYDRWLKVITGEWTEADAQAYLDSLKGKEKEQETSATSAPIYATNGRQRIVSTDGGKTWQEAR
jgi:hypothetical protein